MATFNPSAAPVSTGNSENAEATTDMPSGDYLIRAVWFSRERNKQNTADYLRVKWEILAGPHSNKAFFANLSCQVEVGGVASRWMAISKGLEITESFEVGGEAGDKDFLRLIKILNATRSNC